MENRDEPLLARFQSQCAEIRDLSDLQHFLDAVQDAGPREIADVLLADQYRRWQAGRGTPVEEYARTFPAVFDDESILLELIAEEYGYLEEQSGAQDVEEFLKRFPDLSSGARDRLKRIIAAPLETQAVSDSVILESQAPESQSVPDRISRFRIQKTLGRGSFGVVFKAQDEELKRWVAIKVPARVRVDQAGGVEAFMKEARVIASLDHPAIVPIYDVGKAELDGEQKAFLVTKFIDGSDLKRHIASGVSVAETARIIATVARALHHAHGQGLVHRDVKPGNILIDRENAAHVVDFGLALKDEDFGRGMRLVGTPAYMSPEQALGKGHRVDGRSDIYSLGVVLYEMLTGRRPHRGSSASEILDQIRHDDVRPPRQINDSIPIALEQICLKALARGPADRYTTALDMAEDLERFGDSSDATDSIPYRTTVMSDRTMQGGDSMPTYPAATVAGRGRSTATVGSRSSWTETSNAALKWAIAIAILVGSVGLILFLVNRGNRLAVDRGDQSAAEGKTNETPPLEAVSLTAPQMIQRQESEARQANVPVEWTNQLGMTFRFVPPGIFEMGSDRAEIDLLPLDDWFFKRWQRQRMYNESPKRRVRLTRGFYLGAHEVTVAQFRAFVDATGYRTTADRNENGGFGWDGEKWVQSPKYNWSDPGFEQSDVHPVGNVSWDDAVAFCQWLSDNDDHTYRLPTEAEWEYACRAGTTTWFYSGDRDEGLKNLANIADESLAEMAETIDWGRPWYDGHAFTAPVGSFEPNALGLFDMHGNVWEWCHDWYSQSYYAQQVNTDPPGPRLEDLVIASEIEINEQGNPVADGQYHVFRGGGWDNYPGFCRSADRYSSHSPIIRTHWAGFRVVRNIE